MKLNFEKHQRNYTLLASSEIMEEFFTKNMVELFDYKPKRMYLLIENGIFYHYIPSIDYRGWPLGWIKNNDLQKTKKYFINVEKELLKYEKFLKKQSKNFILDLKQINFYIRFFIPAIIISAYVPEFCQINKDFFEFLCKKRTIFEEVHRTGIEYQEKILNKLERELNYKANTLRNLTAKEFQDFVSTKKVPKTINFRNKLFLVEHSSKGISQYQGKTAHEIVKKIDPQKNNKLKSRQLIKGQPAFIGKVSGKVRIIRLIEDAKNLKSGEILVTSMTDPRYLSAMKRAAAFVTDEGGVLCHAAIVARELKKPCIIGTKISTQSLRDGDLVEVDACKGIVKIIN